MLNFKKFCHCMRVFFKRTTPWFEFFQHFKLPVKARKQYLTFITQLLKTDILFECCFVKLKQGSVMRRK